jgi:Uma2 family endonuclease
MTTLAPTRMTVDEFIATAEAREGRWELENGVAYELAPERLTHGRAKMAAFVALQSAIRAVGLSCEAVTSSVAVKVAAFTAYQPDALVYCGPRLNGEAREVENPVILVEVASPSTG